MKRFVRSLGNVLLTLLVIILIVYGWVFVEIKLMLRSYPEFFGHIFYLQAQTDMSPEFEGNDVVIVKKNQPYNTGDIIMYFDSKDSKYKIHYVVSQDADSVVTKSATSSVNNEKVSKNNVIGRAIGKVVFMGTIVSFFTNKMVLITIAVAGIVFLVISQYMEYKPKKTAEPEKTQEDVK